ncbi:MAG: PDZ domain-containing protein [Pirellulales bacterium]|nr:PDZ domain-containing protein [Pirellulales bacterium]
MRNFSLVVMGLVAVALFLPPRFVLAQGEQSALSRLEQQITGTAPPARQIVEPGYLGAEMDDSHEGGQGIRVLKVLPGSPADVGGLAVNDLITAVNRQPVRNLEALAQVLVNIPAHHEVSFNVVREHPTRGSESLKVQATLGVRPDAERTTFPGFGLIPGKGGVMQVVEANFKIHGFTAHAMNDQLREQMGAASAAAVLVVNVTEGSPAHDGGLRRGDLIVQAGQAGVRTPTELANVIQSNERRAVSLVIIRDGVARQAQLPALRELIAAAGGQTGQQRDPRTLVLEPQSNADARIQQLETRVRALEEQLRQLQQRLDRTVNRAHDEDAGAMRL